MSSILSVLLLYYNGYIRKSGSIFIPWMNYRFWRKGFEKFAETKIKMDRTMRRMETDRYGQNRNTEMGIK
jgi:hypothetical protein